MAFLGPERWRPTMYNFSSLPAAPAHARRLRGRGGGGQPGGAGDLLRLLLRQYVQESFGEVEQKGEEERRRGRQAREEEATGELAALLLGCWSRQRLGAEEEHGEVETEAGSGKGGAHGVGLGVLQVWKGWRP